MLFRSALTNWKQVAYGEYHALAVKTDGTLWSWGQNTDNVGTVWGLLGQGNTTHVSSPVQVGALTNWKQVAGGGRHSAAVKTDGTLWTWGQNSYGQLAQGDITHRSSPTQVGSLTNWSSISVGYGHSVSVKTDGTLWAWGYNYYGQLAQGDITHRSSPTQVGSLTNWSSISGGRSEEHTSELQSH